MESAPSHDPNCSYFCGPDKPYMFYDGDSFCVEDANQMGRWVYVDFSTAPDYYNTYPPVVASCQ